jgi:hypothetical protein
MNLLSDAAQSETWPTIKPLLTKGKTLYFSHGFLEDGDGRVDTTALTEESADGTAGTLGGNEDDINPLRRVPLS